MRKRKNKKTANNGTEQETFLVKKVTLDALNKKYNTLARKMGLPCLAEADEIFNGAVMSDATVMHSKEYACYRVDLAPFKGEFDRIRFRATTNGDDVVFGMLVDKNGNLELIAKTDKPGDAINNIPLSANSKALYATMPLKNGKPAWKNVTIELLTNGGIIADLCDAFCTIHDKIQALEARIKELTDTCKTEVEIHLN